MNHTRRRRVASSRDNMEDQLSLKRDEKRLALAALRSDEDKYREHNHWLVVARRLRVWAEQKPAHKALLIRNAVRAEKRAKACLGPRN